MQLPFLMPMFDDRVSFHGVPAELLLLGVAGVGFAVALLVIRRATTIEPVAQSFRAADNGWRRQYSYVAAGLLLLVVAAAIWLVRY